MCPRCKGQLVLRKGKYGEFYGCSNYPNCKFKLKKIL
ncbi:topoisomerase DNA-binding C4 zinc finger domain-containing protein [Brachyspira sp.]|nr:topoisomerase DNA-binding C4 zinc finger domain-containing protein [Brachyspira sp.]